jgi:hypothetical protein
MSSPGYTSISAIVVLESPRPVNPEKGQKNIVFDANFFVTEGSRNASLGLLRYFASDDIAKEIQNISEKGFQKAFIVANVRCLFRHKTLL